MSKADWESLVRTWLTDADGRRAIDVAHKECRLKMQARNNEGKFTEGGHYNPRAKHNSVKKTRPWQCTLWYQPIDEIRDYFGDDYALYFAWIGLYTRSLATLSVLGVVVMLYGSVTARTIDPDKNDLTLLYSVFVAVWSVMFLQRWARRENELRFLWGTEKLSQIVIHFRQQPHYIFDPDQRGIASNRTAGCRRKQRLRPPARRRGGRASRPR